jgi:C4-dicarboxylate-specific signal transduction histidine kinase
VDRLLAAAARLHAEASELPLLGGDGRGEIAGALSRAALAFERLAASLATERERLAAKVRELTDANRALAETRETLLRTEKLATVGRLAAGLAHEVGNPLGAITGYAELARTRLPKTPDPDLADALARIVTAAERIDRTVRHLLDFARPSTPLLAPTELAPVVDASIRLARVQARFKHVDVEVALEPGLPRVQANEHHLSQVLLNLLLNAGDAVSGSGRVRIAARVDGAQVALVVADSGPGIAPADLPRIFDPFFTTKEPGAGTGLGLAISHRIMEAFGGEITARNGESGGAVFELHFRVALRNVGSTGG